jgi:hypothetical protein
MPASAGGKPGKVLRSGLLNFSKGVISEHLLGRVDVAAYNAGLKRGENIIVLKQGAFTIRPGWRFISFAGGEGERVFTFQFSDEQAYALAFGDLYMQPMAGGGMVLEEELEITGATSADPIVITAAFHGYAAGEKVFIDGVAGAMGLYLNGREWDVVASLSDSTFSIDADGTGIAAFTTATGGITRVGAPPAPPAVPPAPAPYVPPDPPIVVNPGGSYEGGLGGRPWYQYDGQIP